MPAACTYGPGSVVSRDFLTCAEADRQCATAWNKQCMGSRVRSALLVPSSGTRWSEMRFRNGTRRVPDTCSPPQVGLLHGGYRRARIRGLGWLPWQGSSLMKIVPIGSQRGWSNARLAAEETTAGGIRLARRCSPGRSSRQGRVLSAWRRPPSSPPRNSAWPPQSARGTPVLVQQLIAAVEVT